MYKTYPIKTPPFLNTNQYSDVPQNILDRYKTAEAETQELANAHNQAFNTYKIILTIIENHDYMKKCYEEIRQINIESSRRPYTDEERKEIDNIHNKMEDYKKAQRPDIDALKNDYLLKHKKTQKAWLYLEKQRTAIRTLFPYVAPVSETTDNEVLQCSICTTNKKDRVLPCGHLYCSVCVSKCKSTCPTCKKHFEPKNVIRVYLE